MNVGERAQGLSRDNVPEGGSDSGRAERRLQRWRAQTPFTDDSYFARRLEADGLTENGLRYLLGETAESLGERVQTKPEWLAELEQAFAHAAAGSEGAQGTRSETREPLPSEGFLGGIAPLVRQGLERVREGVAALKEAHPRLPFEPDTVARLFLPPLLATLSNYSSRAVVLELNVARLRGELKGDTAEERFKDFSKLIAQPDRLLTLLLEYPVLARQLVTTVRQWAVNCLEVLGRLCADWEEIVATLSPEANPGLLTHVTGDAGDTHRRGRSVSILSFGDGLRVVYKPHSLGVDTHFNELLEWLNRRGARPAFRTLKVIDREAYGWVEFIKAGGCETPEQVKDFYRRQGGLLALLYALEATDFHFENLIASGEHPVLIDLESLFQHRTLGPAGAEATALTAGDAFANSVMRIGMLPHRLWAVDELAGVDVSALSGAGGQMTPFPVLAMENEATDSLRFVRKRVPMPGHSNLPSLAGGAVSLQDHEQDLVAGFTSVYRLLLREREQLLTPGGPLHRFGEDEVRLILRATNTYLSILIESFHPDVLRDALDRDRLFDRLWEATKFIPELCAAVPAELRDLRNGDVPLFTSRPTSRDLVASDGQLISGVSAEPSLETVARRVRQLGEDDLARQVWFITASISSLTLGTGPARVYEPTPEAEAGEADRARLLAAAGSLADRLGELALRSEGNVNWLGLSFIGQRRWTLMPLSANLYDGTLGVALFLAYAGEVLGEQRHTSLARMTLDGLLPQLDIYKKDAGSTPPAVDLGGYSGLGSVLHTLTHAGVLWGRPDYFATGESLLASFPRLIEIDETFDILSGSAGAILNLLAFHHATGSEAALGVARRSADHILAHARTMERGVAWDSKLPVSRPLTGFSHGAAGIGHALLELAATTGEEKYEHCARGAFEYERGLFSPERGNWPDFRLNEGEAPQAAEDVPYPTFWCHGAPGIGLSRLGALRHLWDERLSLEVRAAAQAILAEGFGGNHSLCHGDVGNLEFLFEAGRELRDEGLLARAGRILAAVLHDADRRGWCCGTPRGTETPGLMTGLAGIGYGLLRLAEPGRVPSVLTLGRPVMHASAIPGWRPAVAVGR
jgi:type 2 lantibiotic biosynthesis protein LanM